MMDERGIRNPRLFAALREYCLQTLRRWQLTYPTPESLPREAFNKAHFEGQQVSYTPEVRLDVFPLMLNFPPPQDVPARGLLDEAMRADQKVARHLDTMVGHSGASMRLDIPHCLRAFVGTLLREQQSLEFSERSFASTYAALEEYFYSDSVRLRFVAPLPDFQMEADAIRLGDEFRIARLSTCERQAALDEAQRLPHGVGIRDMSYGFEQFAIETIVDTPKIFGPRTERSAILRPSQVAPERIEEAISALRLFKTGGVRYTVIRQRSIGWNPGVGAMTQWGFTGHVFGPPYTLNATEVDEFRAFWPSYRRARERTRRRLDLALRRLNFAYDRWRPEDRLVDYMIGLEALLTKGEERGDLAYRLALRGSRMLGNDADSRSAVHLRLKAAYEIRSAIVHGSQIRDPVPVGGDRVAFAELVENVAEYLRRAIKELMERTEHVNEAQAITAVDADIVTGS
jgi:hypothetical protein